MGIFVTCPECNSKYVKRINTTVQTTLYRQFICLQCGKQWNE